MRRAHQENATIDSLAEQERNGWFVRDMLVDATLKHTGNDNKTAMELLQSAMAQLVTQEDQPSRAP